MSRPREAEEPTTAEAPTPPSKAIAPPPNWPVLAISGAMIIAIAAWAIIAPENANTVITTIVGWLSANFGWYYILTATLMVVFVIIIALSRMGRIKLGPDHSRPQFNLFTWTAMLFAAGIGIDLMFFSVSEPASQFLSPPEGAVDQPLDPSTDPAGRARMAVVWTLFHYGITGWAMYALMGMAFAYFAYRKGMPLSIRSILYWALGKRINGWLGHTVDIAAVLGTVFGIATSLGIGVVQLNFGLYLMFGIPQGVAAQIGLIALSVILATISTVTGVEKGIRRLSELNVILAIVLLGWVTVTGNTRFLFDSLVTDIGDYAANFPHMMLNVFPFIQPDDWMASWTLFFWAWWIAWAPFVGLFLARISRGRTIRQFVTGVLVVPFAFIAIFISIFGNSALHRILGGDLQFAQTAMDQPESAFYMLLESYPGAFFVIGLATVVGLLFYVTSADSGALVLANFTCTTDDPKQDGPKGLRVFWAVATGVLTLAMLIVGGVATLQAATLIIGLPFSVVLYLVMISLYRALHQETLQADGRMASLPTRLVSGDGLSWKQRLKRSTSFPAVGAVRKYADTVAKPALQEVGRELAESGADVSVDTAEVPSLHLPQVSLRVEFGEDGPFVYQIYPVAAETPSFAIRSQSPGADTYYRLEVFTADGSRGYDVFGFTKEQLISDVISNYESHLEYLRISDGTPVDLTESRQTITTDWADDFASESEEPS
ncbi:BCCT family transporter [Brevibacterium sp. 5221]|uniref:BCCT family transporter n=1 Tax=Brevibacterium rongguiense TaxID=2695267 RepID=A0A6N9H4Y4_9MICO|nr:choline BCCT transporter BetT [Brevibacterium rongguiense]MYM19127.1 BCCT family transporter [Brevibacterium rongguiense]